MTDARDHDQNQLNDARLITSIRDGDRLAFEELYKIYARDLISFARTYLPIGTAEDVVQDVFVSVWEKRGKLKIQSSLRGYLFGAIKRKARDVKRHYKVEDKASAFM